MKIEVFSACHESQEKEFSLETWRQVGDMSTRTDRWRKLNDNFAVQKIFVAFEFSLKTIKSQLQNKEVSHTSMYAKLQLCHCLVSDLAPMDKSEAYFLFNFFPACLPLSKAKSETTQKSKQKKCFRLLVFFNDKFQTTPKHQ